MSEHLRHDWKRLGAAIEPDWTSARAVEIKSRIDLQRRERKRRRTLITSVVIFVSLSAATFASLRYFDARDAVDSPGKFAMRDSTDVAAGRRNGESSPDFQSPKERPFSKPLATAVTADAQFSVEEGATTRTYRIARGGVRFDTGRDEKKRLLVKTGVIVVEDIGTVFTVEALSDGRARVGVSDGRVVVTWPEGRAELVAGENGLFPPSENVIAKGKSKGDSAVRTVGELKSDWRGLARNGDFGGAFRIIDKTPSAVLNRVEDLLLAADVMRLSGRPKQAVFYLEKIIKEHNADPRADLAAFTVGRVFLDELGSPRQAARAFASAGRKGSPLAEEALAREVEAWSRAGETDRARTAAEIYLQKFPNSARIEVVRAFGGLKAP